MDGTLQADAADQPSPSNSRSRLPAWASLGLRFAATSLLVALVLRTIDWVELRGVLVSLDWRWWIGAILVAISAHTLAGVRWAGLARPIGFLHPTSSYVRRFFEGMFFSLCLPTSIGGDVVKAYRLSATPGGRLLAGCTVLADRLCGLSALVVLASTSLVASRFGLRLPAAIAVAGMLMVAVIAGMILGVTFLDRLLSSFPGMHPARQFVARLLPYQQRPSLLARAVGWSMLIQVGFVLCVMLMARGMRLAVPTAVWFYAVPIVSLATVLPISISGVGVREYGFVHLLGSYGVTEEQAVALGMLWFLAQVGNGMIGGAFFLLDRGVPLPTAVEPEASPASPA
jgi:uncharacterized membrane protein YbhN (UPF0104 family)